LASDNCDDERILASHDLRMTRSHLAFALAAAVCLAACSGTATPTVATPTATPTPLATITKNAATHEPLAPPTYVRWAVDKSAFAERPYSLVLIHDGVATNFRVVDGSGQVVLRVPIAGSGIFGPETCAVRDRSPGKAEGFTYLLIDADTFQRFIANASTYRIEADSVGGRTVTVPLTDSGCRAV
jgi:hypothetical protein